MTQSIYKLRYMEFNDNHDEGGVIHTSFILGSMPVITDPETRRLYDEENIPYLTEHSPEDMAEDFARRNTSYGNDYRVLSNKEVSIEKYAESEGMIERRIGKTRLESILNALDSRAARAKVVSITDYATPEEAYVPELSIVEA